MGLLWCVDVFEEMHAGRCGPHMNGFTLGKKIMRAGYFFMTMESDSICYVQKCHHCHIHGDFIRVPQNDLNVMGSPWSFAAGHGCDRTYRTGRIKRASFHPDGY